MAEGFKDLVVWQKAIELTMKVYKLTSGFPDSERFGLINQMRRASVSIPSNIAEGYARSGKGEYLQFLSHSRGSCAELETQLVIAKGLGFGQAERLDACSELCDSVGRLLSALSKAISAKQRESAQQPQTPDPKP
ncbi:MAG: four helix bundle protein [Terracidiphilus sp.]